MTLRLPVEDPRRVGLERAMGVRTNPAHMQFRVEPFPKKSKCKPNEHQWGGRQIYAGRATLQCRRCGAWVFEDVLNHTLGKQEPQKAFRERNWLMDQRQLLLRKRILDSMSRR